MPSVSETVLTALAIALMLIAMLASIIPFIPGPALVWAVGVVYAALTGFQRVTWAGVALMTVFMLLGVTSGWWMPALGMRAQGGSCLSILGALIGGLVGTFVIPIPIIGTLFGAVIGATLFEFARAGELRAALHSGGAAVMGYLLGLVVEFAMSALIFVVFVGSLILSG